MKRCVFLVFYQTAGSWGTNYAEAFLPEREITTLAQIKSLEAQVAGIIGWSTEDIRLTSAPMFLREEPVPTEPACVEPSIDTATKDEKPPADSPYDKRRGY